MLLIQIWLVVAVFFFLLGLSFFFQDDDLEEEAEPWSEVAMDILVSVPMMIFMSLAWPIVVVVALKSLRGKGPSK